MKSTTFFFSVYNFSVRVGAFLVWPLALGLPGVVESTRSSRATAGKARGVSEALRSPHHDEVMRHEGVSICNYRNSFIPEADMHSYILRNYYVLVPSPSRAYNVNEFLSERRRSILDAAWFNYVPKDERGWRLYQRSPARENENPGCRARHVSLLSLSLSVSLFLFFSLFLFISFARRDATLDHRRKTGCKYCMIKRARSPAGTELEAKCTSDLSAMTLSLSR